MSSKIIIRKIKPDKYEAVWKVTKTLGIVERYFFYYLGYKIHKTEALVAVDEERIVGCVIPRVITMAGEKPEYLVFVAKVVIIILLSTKWF